MKTADAHSWSSTRSAPNCAEEGHSPERRESLVQLLHEGLAVGLSRGADPDLVVVDPLRGIC
jgi:hypothetical protein